MSWQGYTFSDEETETQSHNITGSSRWDLGFHWVEEAWSGSRARGRAVMVSISWSDQPAADMAHALSLNLHSVLVLIYLFIFPDEGSKTYGDLSSLCEITQEGHHDPLMD